MTTTLLPMATLLALGLKTSWVLPGGALVTLMVAVLTVWVGSPLAGPSGMRSSGLRGGAGVTGAAAVACFATGAWGAVLDAVDDDVEVQCLFLRRSRPRKFEKVLDDASGAASLAVSHFQLALGVVVHALAFAQKFASPQNRG